MKFVVQVEIEHRMLYGPFDTIDEAVAVANRFQDEFVSDVPDSTIFTKVKKLLDVPWFNPSTTDPNQTMIQDHIDDIGDAMT